MKQIAVMTFQDSEILQLGSNCLHLKCGREKTVAVVTFLLLLLALDCYKTTGSGSEFKTCTNSRQAL